MHSLDATRFYDQFEFGVRTFVKLRSLATSFKALAAHLPQTGHFLDAGCGHGLMAATLALESESREVHAIDHDERRIAKAKEAYAEVAHLTFEVASLESPPSRAFHAITAIDVLHYLSPSDQEEFLKYAHEHLSQEGILLIRDVDASPSAVTTWNKLYEKAATAIGMTKSQRQSHFRTAAEWRTLLYKTGFVVVHQERTSRLFADTLFKCVKRNDT